MESSPLSDPLSAMMDGRGEVEERKVRGRKWSGEIERVRLTRVPSSGWGICGDRVRTAWAIVGRSDVAAVSSVSESLISVWLGNTVGMFGLHLRRPRLDGIF